MKLNSGAELVMKLNDTGNPELLKSLFYLRTKEWPFHMMSTDSGTVNAFCDVKLNTSQSFDLIPMAIELCFDQQNPTLFATALSLLEYTVLTVKRKYQIKRISWKIKFQFCAPYLYKF